jgi:hypothetical protein
MNKARNLSFIGIILVTWKIAQTSNQLQFAAQSPVRARARTIWRPVRAAQAVDVIAWMPGAGGA